MGAIARLLGKEPYNDWPRSYSSFRSDMATAAGVGVARLRCHRNTWAYLEEVVPRDEDRGAGDTFRPPSEEEIVAEKDGLITVPLSGTSLAAVLSWCRTAAANSIRGPWSALDASIGRRVGTAISQALRNVVPSHGQDGPTAVIYLDDRITAKDTTP